MIQRALLSAIAVCFAVAGCENKPTDTPKPKTEAAVVPLPPAAPAAPAASAGQDAKASSPQVAAVADTKQAAPMPGAPALKGCAQGNCKITIDVGAGCAITASPPDRGVWKDNKGDTIMWTIATQGWTFEAANGIEFAPNNQFSGKVHNGNVYKWKDANTDTQSYKYKIHVTDGKQKCSKDPSIVNGVEVQD